MPNIKSAKKRVKTSAKRALRNSIVKSNVKTAIKKFDTSLEAEDKKTVDASFKEAVKKVDMAKSKGVINKNAASRKKSILARKLNEVKN